MGRLGWLVAGIALILLALVVSLTAGAGLWGPMMGRPTGGRPPARFSSNGQRIYFTATSQYGDRITFTGGPPWLQVHGGSCVNCHGTDGRGGIPVMMTNRIASDIRYGTLTEPMHQQGEEHPPYTDALIKRAITRGLDPAGKPLGPAMPRWQMSNRDLSDLLAYLKALDGR